MPNVKQGTVNGNDYEADDLTTRPRAGWLESLIFKIETSFFFVVMRL